MDNIDSYLEKSTAVILVGGKSSRMEYKDKYSLKIGEQRFIDRIIKELNCFDNIMISANRNQNLSEFKYKVLIDEIEEIGPIGGIYTAMNNTDSDILFFCTCDMPNISKDIVYKLYSSNDSECDCIIPTINGRIHSLFGIYKTSIKSIIKDNIDSSDYKIKNLLNKINTKYIELGDEYSNEFTNVNTTDEYREIIQ